MAFFFRDPEDLSIWVQSKKSSDESITTLMQCVTLMQLTSKNNVSTINNMNEDEQEINDTCKAIFNNQNSENAAKILFGILAKHNITTLRKAKI